MHKTTTQVLSLTVFSLFFTLSLSAQMIWPGDISNNGIVNGVDYLYWGVANQNSGPARPGATTSWEEQPMGATWSGQYPAGMNHAYGDVNGDGQITPSDAIALGANFHFNHGTQTPDPFQTGPFTGTEPNMLFEHGSDETTSSGQTEGLTLAIGEDEDTFSALYGITFTLNYRPGILAEQDGIQIGVISGSFINPDNSDVAAFVHNDNAAGQSVITIVRTDQNEVSGGGKVARILLNFGDLTIPGTPEELEFTVSDLMTIDHDMNLTPVVARGFSFFTTGTSGGSCPNTVSPVCGVNGQTYLNSCYAEADGVFDYTSGTCFDDSCIDPDDIDPVAVCPTVYEPVCGCNDVTYSNQCAADAAGVQSTTPGPCSPNDCYDPQYVITSQATTLNPTTGVITIDCPSGGVEVCGCNGVTYTNACYAEASGITIYTQGSCESACVDPYQMDPDAVCPTVYDPVCGCNGVTYSNDCIADAAGVTSYTNGPCNGGSPWCSEAIPVQCGDFLPYETTIGAGNNINQYPGCTSGTFLGPDRVYVINKQSAGDLQIGLEILTPNMDLDLFLLADNCSQLTCLAKSTTSNTATNNEGIVLEDAPIGTYYIVVDGQYANSEGNFRLEVSCGYLYCGESVPLQCGQPYQGTNLYGNDDVSLYGCDGPVYNVENNGPEIVHTFTTTADGPVNISLTGLSANLELFLLRSCDRGDCIEYSQNSGSNSEYLNEYLTAGTYYIVVDGYNGAVSDYTLLVECSSSCNFSFTDLTATSSGCGSNSGSIHVASSGGTPNYLVTYSGPLSGSFTTGSNSCTIYNLPPGTYTITKTDSQGCSITGTVTILGGGSLSANLTPNDAVCMNEGSIGVYISNGVAPYHVYLTGPTSGSTTVNSNNFTINDLEAGNYTVHITDALGCSISQQVTIDHTSGNFIWNYTVTAAACGGYGAIHIDTYNGDAPYNILVSGPVSGGATVYANSFNITQLPGGTYQVTVEDDNWCTYTRTIVIPDGNLTIEAVPNSGVCGQDGSITVNVDNGSPDYTITWTGQESGSIVTSGSTYVIPNLSPGDYLITVEDGNWCSDSQAVTVSAGEGGGLTFQIIPLPGSCMQNGALWIDIYNGSPTYTISYTGPESGITTTDNDGFDIANLPCGTYQVTITDSNGCGGTQTVVLGGCEEIDIDLTPQSGICGQPGSILVTLNGGSPTYTVTWTGPMNGSTTTSTNLVNIPNLPAGTYNVQVLDMNGCSDYAVTQVSTAEGNLTLSTSVTEAVCGAQGGISLFVSGGAPVYQVSWTGPESGSQSFSTNTTFIGGLIAGTYTLYVTDANGCSSSITESVVNVGSDLDISLLGNDGICSQFGNIGVYIANGVAPYTVTWNGPVSGSGNSPTTVYQIPNTPAGTYNVLVTDANGCSTSGTVQVNTQNNLLATLQVFDGVCGNNGNILVNITQGSPNYTITWTGPESGSQVIIGNQYAITGLPSGVYTVVITDSNGCTRTLVETVTNSNGGLDIVTSLIYNVCGQYNTIWTDINGGTPPYTVTWQGTENGSGMTNTQGFEIMNLPPGSYKVIVVDVNGCMDMEQDIIIYPSPVDLFEVTPNNGICGELGSIQVDIDSGTAPYVLNWNGPLSGTQNYNNAGVSILNNLPGGTYTFTLTDANGCTETETVVLDTGDPLQIITALIYNECGQYNTIWTDIIGGTPPYTITWQGTENGSGMTNTQGFEIEDLPPGSYKVIVVDANGCMDMEQDIIVYEAPVDIFTATTDPGVCGDDGKINIDVTGGTGPYVLTYTGPVSGTIPVVFGPQVLANVPAGTYTLTLTDANGCVEVETVTVVSTGSPITIVTSLIYNDCGQYNTIWVDITGGTGPYIVTWEGTENGSGTTNTQGFEIMDLPPGTYKVTVVDANGCMVMQQGIIVYPAPIELFYATPVNGTCAGPGSIVVNVTGGTPNYALTWTGPENGSANFGGNIYTIPNLTAGTYTLILSDANGCVETEVVTVSTTEDDVDLTAQPNNGNCSTNGSITTQSNGGDGSYVLTWTGPESGSANVGTTPYVIPNLPAGTYTIFTDDGTGCDDAETVTLSTPEDDLQISLTPTAGNCASNGQIGVSIIGGNPDYTISWTGPSNGSVTIGGQFVIIPDLAAGTYTVTVVSGDGCIETTSTVVTNPGGALTVTATGQAGSCGNPGLILVNIFGGNAPYVVNWSGPSSGSFQTNSTSVSIPGLLSGGYTVTVTSGSCSGSVSSIVPASAPDLEVTATPSSSTCGQNGSIYVSLNNATGSSTITWTGPENGSQVINGSNLNIPNLPSGMYTITATNGSCSDVTQVTILSGGNLEVYATPVAGDCGESGSIVLNITGGSAPYLVSWTGPTSGSFNTNSTSVQLPGLLPGAYNITVTSGSCQGSANGIVVPNPESNLIVTATPSPATCGEEGSIYVSLTNATGSSTITWTGPENGSQVINGSNLNIPNLPSGMYTITATNGSCSDVTQVTILSGGNLTVYATPVAGNCGESGSIVLNITGGSAPYIVSWTGPTPGSFNTNSTSVQIPGLLPGAYNITVTSGSCQGSANGIVVSNPESDLSITATPSPAPCGEEGSVYVSLTNATGTSTITWTGPESGNQVIGGSNYTIPNLASGTYTITATNGSCSDVTQVIVSTTESDIVVYATPVHAVCGQNGSINVSFTGGQAPYTVSWTGPSSGSTSTNGTNFQIPGLNPGTYTVTVSSGSCSGSATTTINNQNNGLSIQAIPQNGGCLLNPGFTLNFSGGTAPYFLTWSGPVSGSTNVDGNSHTLSDVPTGIYSFTVTDASGCSISTISTVTTTTIGLNLTGQDGVCGDNTAIFVNVTGGTGPYQISWIGEIEGFATSNSPNYTINNLPGSPYLVTVQDANGCTATSTITVQSGVTDFEVIHSVSNNGCGALNNIWMDFFNGVGPYTIEWIGPSSGTETTDNAYYDIQNAPTGIYIIIVTDGNGCVDVQQVEVYNILNTLEVTVVPNNGSCGELATIDVYIAGGTPWYTIAWYLNNSPEGEQDINSGHYSINNLDAGSYYVLVTDENGCSRSATVEVETPVNLLQLETTIVGPGCTSLGSIGLNFGGGVAPYTIIWSGQQSGSANSNTDNYLLNSLTGGTYQVTVTDSNGCTNTINVLVPGTDPGDLVANFDYEEENLTVSFMNMSSNGSYNWTFGDGATSSIRHPEHTYANPGTYQVCLTVSGSCGSDTHCETITVTAEDNLAILDIGESEGGLGATIQVPVTIQNVQNIISLAGSIEVMNEEVGVITGVTNSLIAPQYNVSNNTFSYFNNSGDYLDVNPDDVLFFLNVLLVGDVGESTIIKFVQTPLPIEVGVVVDGTPTVTPYTLSMGSATIVATAALNGTLTTYWTEGIMDAAVTVTGPGLEETMMTNESGNYNLPALTPGMEYTVSANKDIAHSNGLSTYALFIGQRFLLGMNPPQITSPYQVIAGDANCSDAFTTLDLFLIQRLIIGAQENFDQCPSWVFVTEGQDMPTDFDAYNVFPYASTNTMMLMEPETANFVGVKVGDILGHANPNNFDGEDDNRTNEQLPFTAENTAVAAGEEVTLYFRSGAFADIVSYQFGLQFPTDQVEYLEFFPAEEQPFQTVVVGDAAATEGELRLSWFSLDGNGHSSAEDQALFAIKFRALTDIDDWTTVLRLDPGTMLPEAYNSYDESLNPAINFGEVVTSVEAPMESKFRLDQNTPNPFNGNTTITFRLSDAGTAAFVIHDAFGQEIYREINDYSAGENRLVLDRLDLPAGVYYYTLRAGTATATRTMVVVK